MGLFRIVVSMLAAGAFAAGACLVAPHAWHAGSQLAAEDDPPALADLALIKALDPAVARREIETALADGDADLAHSFLELARDRGIAVDPALAARVAAANEPSMLRGAGSFARGLVIGEPDDLAGLAGTAVGDLFVFGDIRDAAREGSRLALGQQADHLVLGLACVGLAITAGTYASLGAGAPARVGISLLKAARKTGRIGGRMADMLGRSLREAVDWKAVGGAFTPASLVQPAVAVRAARAAVKADKADGLMRLVGDVGRVQSKAGTRAALDGLRVAEGPRDMARVAKLAERNGSKTRAILKLLGRAAIAITMASFDIAVWLFSAALSVLGFVASCKAAVERITWRHLRRRRRRRQAAERGFERVRTQWEPAWR